ncbi:hypothetical protein Tco_0918907 [Tanacetum coccineum]
MSGNVPPILLPLGTNIAHEGPSDTGDTKIAALRLKFNAFKALKGEKVNGTFTRLKCLLNDLENNGVSIPKADVNATFVNSFPRKWLNDATKSINFTLFGFDKPLSFTSDEFSSIIGLNYSENYVHLPSKETMRSALSTLGLVEETNTSPSSTDLIVKESSPSLQVADTQLAKEPVATADATQSINSFESAEELRIQPKTTDSTKATVQESIVKKAENVAEITFIGHVTLEKVDGDGANKTAEESPYNTKSKIKFVKRVLYSDTKDQIMIVGTVYSDMEDDTSVQHQEFHDDSIELQPYDQLMNEADSDLEPMPRDEIESLSGFKADETN